MQACRAGTFSIWDRCDQFKVCWHQSQSVGIPRCCQWCDACIDVPFPLQASVYYEAWTALTSTPLGRLCRVLCVSATPFRHHSCGLLPCSISPLLCLSPAGKCMLACKIRTACAPHLVLHVGTSHPCVQQPRRYTCSPYTGSCCKGCQRLPWPSVS
jgi:hypothetical protein